MVSNAQALFALRSSGADWLATLITALDEASRDPEFTPEMAAIVADLARQSTRPEGLPGAVVDAALQRTTAFNQRLAASLAIDDDDDDLLATGPRLTVVGS